MKMADAMDAMLSERSYKKQMDIKETILEIKRCRGKDFDPEIADIAIEILNARLTATEQVFDDIVMPANLLFRANKRIYTLSGFVLKQAEQVLFLAVNFIDDLDDLYVENLILAFERQNILYKFKVKKYEKIEDNRLLLKELSPLEANSAFKLLWMLSGDLVNLKNKQVKRIIITAISGESLDFSFEEENVQIDENDIYAVIIRFEDGTNVPVSGRITERIKINRRTHYTFEFVDLQEKYRDEIFRQIFRKQISIKKMFN
ncbi:hypothetical protein [Thermosyntropha sp.]|uniref:hypothetical protein n=1 Tax=Thermosyntropha sp. TaxID=2740820 RepID=UPI0025FE856A|nr:hypothetical protein [Thermosyntropha sp.]MBO8158151.1 hypothetical protein [Thermosyntropha sp.]